MAVTDDDAWQSIEVGYSVQPNESKEYVTEVDSLMTVEKVTDVYGNEVNPRDYTVVYFNDAVTVGTFDDSDTIVATGVDGKKGGAPNAEGNYIIAVVQGKVDLTSVADYDDITAPKKSVGFKIVKKTTPLANVVAYEYDSANAQASLSDTTFNYTGAPRNVAFKVGNTKLDGTTGTGDYTIEWTSIPQGASEPTAYASDCYTVTDAGDYTATLTAVQGGDYSGSATVTFNVKGVALGTDEVYVAPTKSLTFDGNGLDKTQIVANGTPLSTNAELAVQLISVNDQQPAVQPTTAQATAGKYVLRLSALKDQSNVTGDSTLVTTYVVTDEVTYAYNGTKISADGRTQLAFDAGKGTSFSKGAIAAWIDDNTDGVVDAGEDVVTDETSVTVTKDGVETEDYSQPGEYVVTLDTPVAAAYAYAGHVSFKFTVAGKAYNNPAVFMAVDGKNVAEDEKLVYTGEAYQPVVLVKDNAGEGATLVEGEDYTVAYTDLSGNPVESITAVGDYKLVVTLVDVDETKIEIGFEVVKAPILSAEPTADFFPTDGTAAAEPSFYGYTEEGLEGQQFPLAAEDISVEYYEASLNDNGTKDDPSDDFWTAKAGAKAIPAEELTEAGDYVAFIYVKTTASNIENGTLENKETFDDQPVHFVVEETAGYNDVAADAWYADSVYKAKDNGYMEGVAAGVFAPDRAMTRAEFAQVVANMAGVGKAGIGETYPTKFSDVPADAWYAKAIEWASRYGIVNGTSETTFEPNGTVTREQIATMLYRYAGNNAQADLTVLDAFVDGAQVSDWAANAMAWAVEEGYMNGKGADDLQPQATATRAEIATLAVRVQPEAL